MYTLLQGPGIDDPLLHKKGFDQGLKGIIPRVMEDIFQHISQEPDSVQVWVSVSYLEVYMDKVRDLLSEYIGCITI